MLVSVVIITRNEAHIIGDTLKSVEGITDDIIIVDSGSTDHTVLICQQAGAKVVETSWDGYGNNKNKGIALAKNDWILNLDADEMPDEELRNAIRDLSSANEGSVYTMRFSNYFLGKWIRHGEWGNDWHIRLFNKKKVQWNNAEVHENLGLDDHTRILPLPGHILHYTTHSLEEYEQKTLAYAKLNAQKYLAEGKTAGPLKKYGSPVFSFLQNYLFRFGFLDGTAGYRIAKTSARYTYLKYELLEKMIEEKKNRKAPK